MIKYAFLVLLITFMLAATSCGVTDALGNLFPSLGPAQPTAELTTEPEVTEPPAPETTEPEVTEPPAPETTEPEETTTPDTTGKPIELPPLAG